MIISFEQSPEYYYNLAIKAKDNGELESALLYCEKAISGKNYVEYKVLLAEIYFSMERYYLAMDCALEALIMGKGDKGRIYDILAKCTAFNYKLFDSLYYYKQKARYEDDAETTEIMNSIIDEITNVLSDQVGETEPNLFVVGKEKPIDVPALMEEGMFYMHAGAYKDALAIFKKVPRDEKFYILAQDAILKCYLKMKKHTEAYKVAKNMLEIDEHNAFALYVLISVCNQIEYVKYLPNVNDEPTGLYYAISAADSIGDYALAKNFVTKLVKALPYSPEVYFIGAGVMYNAKDIDGCKDFLKTLFSTYKQYPADVLLAGLGKQRKISVMFNGSFPNEIQNILRKYVRKHMKKSEDLVHNICTDLSFRKCLELLFECNDTEVIGNTLCFAEVACNKEVNKFLEKILLKTEVHSDVKTEVLRTLLSMRHNGKITLVPSTIMVKVPATKPTNYDKYSQDLRKVYLDAMSYIPFVSEFASMEKVGDITEKIFANYDLFNQGPFDALTIAVTDCFFISEQSAPTLKLLPQMPVLKSKAKKQVNYFIKLLSSL